MTTDGSEAAEADVLEQRAQVFDEEQDDLAEIELDPEHGSAPDVADQHRPVPLHDEDDG